MKHLLPIICLFYSGVLFAQHRPSEGTRGDAYFRAALKKAKTAYKESKPGSPSEPGFTLGTNFLSLLEPEGGPSIVTEYRFNKHYEIGLTTMAILYGGFGEGDYKHRGVRIQPDFKYYFLLKHHKIMPFVGIMGLYKQVGYEKYYYGYPVDTGFGFSYHETKRIWGLSPMIGFKKYIDGDRHHLLMEVYAGLGFKNVTFPGRPAAVNDEIEANTFSREDIPLDLDNYKLKGWYPYIPMGIKIGYRF